MLCGLDQMNVLPSEKVGEIQAEQNIIDVVDGYMVHGDAKFELWIIHRLPS